MIEIMNMRDTKPSEPWDVKVDRSSVLGNPFPMNKEDRDGACDRYQVMFDKIIRKGMILAQPDVDFSEGIERLRSIYKEYGKLRLFCWCSPKRCHAETIKEYLESVI